jgi:uncharacterized protein
MKMGTFVLRQRGLFNLLVIFALVLGFLPASSTPVLAVSPDLVISQVYGGGGNSGAPYTHDFVEVFNRGSMAVSLAGKSIQYASATGTGNFGANSGQMTELPDITLLPGQYYLIQEAGGTAGVALPAPDLVDPTPIAMGAGAGKVALVDGTSSLGCNGGSTPCSAEQLARIIDLVGYGSANFYEGTGAAPTLSNTTAALRKETAGAQDTDDNAADFEVGSPNPRNRSYGFDPAPYVVSTNPAQGANEVSPDIQISVSFSEPVNTASEWFDLTCQQKGTVSTSVSGGPVDFSIIPSEELWEDDTCTLTIYAGAVTDQDDIDPFDAMQEDFVLTFAMQTSVDVCTLPFTGIYDIQGSGPATPISGVVTTQGVVVGDYEGPSPALRGFYLQDLTGDGKPGNLRRHLCIQRQQ